MSLFLPWRRALPAALLALSALGARAQNEPVKYGKVDAKLFDPAQYPSAAGAPAVVLCDYGTSRIEGADDGFRVVFDRVTRILVLTKAGYEQATVQIPLYHREADEEKLLNLRGATYNLVGGKLQKQELDPKSVFSEKLDQYHNRRKFTLPGVREGSIVEYAYTIKSDFVFNLQDWQFQRDIPVEWSEYRAVMPSFYQYKQIQHGFLPYKAQETDVVPYHTTYHASSKDGYGTHLTESGNTSTLTTKALRCRWVMEHVPAFREEPYMTTARDYLAGIDFELDLIQFDPAQPHPVTSTWEKISAELTKAEEFGAWISGRTPLTAQAEALATTYRDPATRAAAVQALVQQAVRYNGQERLYATQPLRRVLEQQRGNAAEVNLLLVRTLRDAGLPCWPVLVSTRSHGQVFTELPLLSQFNYVVAAVPLAEGPELLLDATESAAAAGTLPGRCLNGQGRLVAPAGRWLPLTPRQKFTRVTTARFSLDEQGQLQGNLHREYAGYAGLAERNQLAELGEKAYLGALQKQYTDCQLRRSALNQVDSLSKPLVLDVDLTLPALDAGPAQVYLPLLQFFTDRQNPFQPDTRIYPVDFGTQHEDVLSVALTLPKGYAVEELPKNLVLSLPNGDGRYSFEAVLRDNVLYLNSRLQLRKTQYQPSEYPGLRELFTRALAKHTEPLVLRRTR
ncbi:transglutaminase domain-containing protein [Hymenobacter edaphi]|uniref:Transglutaminase-like domain-containing protein n=1 Tax=Hymenobacter edaphi TaxID=2211146 RepID=A0A328BIK7_9BACT|nr:transglutaminase domain-containing protein [Hymenobacter edaphi]RAK65744.1 hypothetical protein DLM85_13555 [Hymenobacter edaphi]